MEEQDNNVKNKNFITKKDLKEILGSNGEMITDSMVKKYFYTIRKLAVDDLEKKGRIIPKKTIIPAAYVWAYLKPYGITK